MDGSGKGWGRWLAALIIALALHAEHSAATTFVLMRETDLIRNSVAVIRGIVGGVATIDTAEGGLRTLIRIDAVETIAGSRLPESIVLEEPGGRSGTLAHVVHGGAFYAAGEQVLVFVAMTSDGSLRTAAMSMGKFSIDRGRDGKLRATRHIPRDVGVVTDEGIHEGLSEQLSLEELLERVRRAGAVGQDASRIIFREYNVRWSEEEGSAFQLIGGGFRWFEPDDGLPVRLRVDPTGDATLGFVNSDHAALAALRAWSGVSGSRLRLAYDNVATIGPFNSCPKESRIVFNDPFNEIENPVDCRGILAIGGFCTSGETRVVNGRSFGRIVVGRVTVADGWGTCPFWNTCNLAELLTHEIGHAVGLDHSEEPSATMHAYLHFDGRCAALAEDDRAAIRYLYPEQIVPAPTSTPSFTRTYTFAPSPTPPRTPPPLATPTHRGAAATHTPVSTATRTATRRPTKTPSAAPRIWFGRARWLPSGRIRVPLYVDHDRTFTSVDVRFVFDPGSALLVRARGSGPARAARVKAQSYAPGGRMQISIRSSTKLVSDTRPILVLTFAPGPGRAGVSGLRLIEFWIDQRRGVVPGS